MFQNPLKTRLCVYFMLLMKNHSWPWRGRPCFAVWERPQTLISASPISTLDLPLCHSLIVWASPVLIAHFWWVWQWLKQHILYSDTQIQCTMPYYLNVILIQCIFVCIVISCDSISTEKHCRIWTPSFFNTIIVTPSISEWITCSIWWWLLSEVDSDCLIVHSDFFVILTDV